MDSLEGTIVSLAIGISIGIGLVGAIKTNNYTQQNALHGTSRQKFIAFSMRIVAVLIAYGIILISARASHLYTEQTVFQALVFFFTTIAVVKYAKKKGFIKF